MAFEEEPRDAATDVNLAAYTPKLFTSGATTTSKVRERCEKLSVLLLIHCKLMQLWINTQTVPSA